MSENILIIAAHPDDEVLGVGGTIWTHAQRGDIVRVLIVAEGARSRLTGTSEEVERLRSCSREAAQILGSQPPVFGAFPDNRLDSVDILDIARWIESWMTDFPPSIVYTHHPNDCNIDHETTHRAALAACRPLPGSTLTSLRLFEVLSSSEWGSRARGGFVPNHYQRLSANAMKAKIAALKCYPAELRDFPHPRSTPGAECLAGLRGSTIGVDFAEAFQVEYQIAGVGAA